MAKKEHSSNTAPEFDPVIINPLIAYTDNPEECAQSVSNVLAFMGHAFRAGQFPGGNNREAADGAGLILETCAAALNFHMQRKAGEV